MSEPFISVIIPVYNVEKYLQQCLDSVTNQTFKNIEIICVNDASTDNSLMVLEEYAKQDKRINLINNEKNIGLGLTRNRGMEIAKGEYIHFLDSDDWLELNAYEEFFKIINENDDIEVVHFRYKMIFPDKVEIVGSPDEYFNKVINPKKFPRCLKNWDRSAWCKFYKREFLVKNALMFNDYPCVEDMEYSIAVLSKSSKVYLSDKILLNYRKKRPGSLMENFYKHYLCSVNSLYTNINICRSMPDDFRESVLEVEIMAVILCLRQALLKNIIKFQEYKKIVLSFDYSVFPKNYENYRWYIYYFELKKYPEFIIILKIYMRNFLKKYFKFLYDILIFWKRKIKCIKYI